MAKTTASDKGKQTKASSTKKRKGKPLAYLEVEQFFKPSDMFSTEKEMCDYIEQNIGEFCSETFCDAYVSHVREYAFGSGIRHGAVSEKGVPNIRADFIISCKGSNYILECKNPLQVQTELTRGIGQLLMYDVAMREAGLIARHVLVSSRPNEMVAKIIRENRLPLDFILFNKKCSAVYYGAGGLSREEEV